MNAPQTTRTVRVCRVYFAVVIVGAAVILLVGSWLFVGIPNIVSSVEERLIVSALRSRPSHSDLVSSLSMLHANWHRGKPFVEGKSYGSFDYEGTCTNACETTLQIAFDRQYSMCTITGDVVTIRFDAKDRASEYKVTPALDSC